MDRFARAGTHCALMLLGAAPALCFPAYGYELNTHEKLTQAAFDASILGDSNASPLMEFGIEDIFEPLFRSRPVALFDPSSFTDARSIAGLGARFEDEPKSQLRFLNHFYDPQQGGIGLSVAGMTGQPSPSWVLEEGEELQELSIRDGLDHHHAALSEQDSSQRMAQLGILLEILGRSVHHLQDMAQPAHVRNDPHPPGDSDNYEEFTDNWFRERSVPSASPYGARAVDLREFDTARKFWSNSGSGIAEFTSRNFVSKDTNFSRRSDGAFLSDEDHLLPIAVGTHRATLQETGIANLPHSLTLVHTQVTDSYAGVNWLNDRASSYGFLTPETGVMSLNRLNFLRNYEILLPRAIAYSAGFINYYFRGRFEVDRIEAAADNSMTVTVRNRSEAEFPMRRSASPARGFELYYDRRDGTRQSLPFWQTIANDTWLHDEERTFSFMPPADVDPRKEKPYVLVFDGTIGTERGIAAVTFGTPRNGILVTPRYPTTDGSTSDRILSFREGGWTAEQDDAVAGTIDWKGHRPEDVLTWGTSWHRYGPPDGNSTVYMNGKALTTGPANSFGSIIGASIRYVNGQRTLNLVKAESQGIHIYSRAFATRYDNEEPWSTVNPLGWRSVYIGQQGPPLTGFFFNSSGTEGQYITRANEGGPDRRIKVALQGDRGFGTSFAAVATVTRTERNFQQENISVSVQSGTCEVTPANPNGELVPAISACGEAAYGGQRTTVAVHSIAEAYADRTTFCVDYRGDEEVFCELMPPTNAITQSESFTEVVDEQYSNPRYCGGYELNSHVRSTTTSTEDGTRMLRVGSAELPWSSNSVTRTGLREYSGSAPVDFAGISNSATSGVVAQTTHLVRADARYDFAVYHSSRTEGSEISESTFEDVRSELPRTITSNESKRTEVVATIGARSEILYRADTPPATTTATLTYSPGTLPARLGGCAPSPSNWDQSTSTTIKDPAATGLLFTSMPGSYAIDREGRLALSQLIRDPSTPSDVHGYRNLLTDGDLPALIPGTPPAEGYSYEIRLIR